MPSTTQPTDVIKNSKAASAYSSLRFPADGIMDQGQMFLSFKKYNRTSPLSPTGELGPALVNITLPLPMSGLEDNTSIKYDEQQLGAAIGGFLSSLANDPNQKFSKAGAFGQAVKTAIGTGADFLAGVAQLPGGSGKAAIDLLAGNINNPNITLAFGGVNLRQHQFSWRLIAKNKTESSIISNIIKQLKINSLPQQQEGNLALKYPNVAIVGFNIPRTGPTPSAEFISMSKHGMFLEDISVKYDGEGHPAFYTDGKPVVVDLSLKFRDRYIITANDYTGEKPSNGDNAQAVKDLSAKLASGVKENFERNVAAGYNPFPDNVG